MGSTYESDRVIDLRSAAKPGEPPVPGAQWDELHGRWEHWDEAAGSWLIVGDSSASPVLPPARNAIPTSLANELGSHHDVDAEREPVHIVDVDRIVAPAESVPGAQWNEVVGRWERWDDAAQAWVEARADSHAR
jgi:hypothetical protein